MTECVGDGVLDVPPRRGGRFCPPVSLAWESVSLQGRTTLSALYDQCGYRKTDCHTSDTVTGSQ